MRTNLDEQAFFHFQVLQITHILNLARLKFRLSGNGQNFNRITQVAEFLIKRFRLGLSEQDGAEFIIDTQYCLTYNAYYHELD